MQCDAGHSDSQDGLCYTPCGGGYAGVGPVCWQRCGVLPGVGGTTDGGTYCTARPDGVITASAALSCPLMA